MTVDELTTMPGTADTLRRAVAASLPTRRPDTLPDREIVLRGVTVDRAHLARYDRVCGLPLRDTLPVTYPHVLAFPLVMRLLAAPGFPLPVIGAVHVANRITTLRGIDAAEPLDFTVRAADLREHERGRQFDVLTTATVAGEPVWHGVATYLRVSGAAGVRAGDRPAPPAGSAVWRVPVRTGTDYAAVSGDHNPIHTSRLGARLFGFPRPIAHGMWTVARCLAALGARVPEATTVDVAFKRPVLLPAEVAFSVGPDPSVPAGLAFAVHDVRTGTPHLTGTLG